MKWNQAFSAIFIVSASLSVQAQQPQSNICRVLEYAELKDMGREGMARLYCQYKRAHESAEQQASSTTRDLKSSNFESNQRLFRFHMDTMQRCSQEMGRIERILGKPEPDCSTPQK